MKITKRQLLKIIREEKEKAENTIKYNADENLKGDQTKLPDALQKAIIDKEEEKNESHHESVLRNHLRKIVRENCGGDHDMPEISMSADDQMSLAPEPELGNAQDPEATGMPCPIKTASKMKESGASEADLMDFVNTLIDEFKSGGSTVPEQPSPEGPANAAMGDLLSILGL